MTRLAPHPAPAVLAAHLERVAALIRSAGDDATARAALLAARGWPASTLGDGGSRGSDDTSSTERAALERSPWADVDALLARQLRGIWHAGLDLQSTITGLLRHAADDDPIPAGRGECDACGHFCLGDGGNDRLRAGLCHACVEARRRWQRTRPDGLLSDFVRDRRVALGLRRPEVQPA